MGILLDWFAGADGIGARSCRAGLVATIGLSPTPLLCLTAVLTGAGTGLTALRAGARRAGAGRFLSARAERAFARVLARSWHHRWGNRAYQVSRTNTCRVQHSESSISQHAHNYTRRVAYDQSVMVRLLPPFK